MLHLSLLNKLSTNGKPMYHTKSVIHVPQFLNISLLFMKKSTAVKSYFHLMFLMCTCTCVDKRFAVKARLTGILVIIVGLLKKYQEDQEKLSVILKLLRSVATNSTEDYSLWS